MTTFSSSDFHCRSCLLLGLLWNGELFWWFAVVGNTLFWIFCCCCGGKYFVLNLFLLVLWEIRYFESVPVAVVRNTLLWIRSCSCSCSCSSCSCSSCSCNHANVIIHPVIWLQMLHFGLQDRWTFTLLTKISAGRLWIGVRDNNSDKSNKHMEPAPRRRRRIKNKE